MRQLLMVLLQLMALMAFFAPPGKNVGGRVQGALRVGGNWSLAARMCQCELGCKDDVSRARQCSRQRTPNREREIGKEY